MSIKILEFLIPLIPLIGWYFIGDSIYYYNNSDFKIARNLVSAIHALTVIFFYQMQFSTLYLFYISRGYYIIDSLYELIQMKKNNSIKLYQLGILLHHALTIIGLNYLVNDLTSHHIYRTYFLAEVSNLPMYLIRYLLHTNINSSNNNKYIIKGLTIIEFAAYIYFRLILCVPIIISVFKDQNAPNLLRLMSLAMYSISGMWTYKLFKQVIN